MDFDAIRAREAAHFLPVVKRFPVALASGSGSRVVDVFGKEYVDLMAGWGVTCIGHSHPALVRAIAEQAGRLMQTTNIFYTLPQLDLCDRLAELTPAPITRAFLTNSGTEAVEGALKLAHRATGRKVYVSTRSAFHGRTLGALQVIGTPKHRDPYAPLLPEQVLVPFDDLAAARRAVDASVAAFIVEPVQGEGGVNVPSPGYLRGLREICDATGALLIFDEVQTGVGRTGTWFACEHEGVDPDVMTLGKGLGGGFPVAAFLTTERVAQTVALGDHGTTFGGNPLACAAANATLRVVEEEKLVARAAELGARLQQRLLEFAAANPDVAITARGRGLLQALVLRDAARAADAARARDRARRARERHRGQRGALLPGAQHPRGRSVARARDRARARGGPLSVRALHHAHDEADALGGREVRHRGEERAVGGARILGALELEAHRALRILGVLLRQVAAQRVLEIGVELRLELAQLLGLALPRALLEHHEHDLAARGVGGDQIDHARVVHAARLALLLFHGRRQGRIRRRRTQLCPVRSTDSA